MAGKAVKREPGFYWVRLDEDVPPEIAWLNAQGEWWCSGQGEAWGADVHEVLSERLSPPSPERRYALNFCSMCGEPWDCHGCSTRRCQKSHPHLTSQPPKPPRKKAKSK